MRLAVFLVCLTAWTVQAADHLQRFSLSHSGRFVAAQTADGSAWVWDMSSGNKRLLSKAGSQPIEFSWGVGDRAVYINCMGRVAGYAMPNARVVKVLTGGPAFSLVDVSPDGQWISSVRENNLWVSASEGKAQKALTQSGNSNLLVGAPDLVYGKEFNVSRHYWWSPDSSTIAYIETQFADENHYVIAGAKLPVFRLKTVDVTTGKSRLIFESNDEWPYILRVAWHPDNKRVFFYRMNRQQQLAELCYFENNVLTKFLTEKDAYWVNVPETPLFLNGGKRVAVSSERTGARHIYLYQLDGQLISDLTSGDLEVYRLHAAEDDGHVYVSGTVGNRQDQQLFRLNLDGAPAQAITTEAEWHEVELSSSGGAYLDYHSTTLKPPALDWHGSAGETREVLPAVSDEKPVANEYFTIKTHDNVDLPARLFKPDDFELQKKYPVILYTFSGPSGRVVKDEWGDWQMAWNRAMVRQGFLVLAVDVRGSGGYGHLFEEYIHYRFGAQETADLREVVSYLRRQSYVDSARLGIWGCDYGAHIVVHAMWQFPGGFKAGFAESPIGDWTKYDAYFAERYLGLPAKRFNEYDDSGPTHDARRMTGSLMVASGADDVLVRPEQTEVLKNAMAHLKKNPEVAKRFFAVDLPHDVGKLRDMMTEFFKRNL